jgi:hypothetical protein
MPRAERRTKKRNDQKRMEAEQLASVTPCSGASIRQGQAALRFDPSGSRTTSRSRIGPSFVNSVLIRASSSSSVAPSVGFLLSSPASRTADSFGCRKAATFSARAAAGDRPLHPLR